MRLAIHGPNLPGAMQRKGTFHVHEAGCRDNMKYPSSYWQMDAGSKREVVEDVYADMIETGDDLVPISDLGPYRDDIHFAPCVTLPEG